MKNRLAKQIPISTQGGGKTDVRTQFAALCYRVIKGDVQVLMVTSRGTQRWIPPKGWPMDGKTPAEAVAQEAWEEAGVRGKAYDQCLGLYSYNKEFSDGEVVPCLGLVYPVKVKSLSKTYPEASERRRKWMSPKKAASKVDEEELSQIILSFNPKNLVK